MSPSMWLYLAGMAVLFVGQRLLAGMDELQLGVSAAGVGVLLAAGALRLRGLGQARRGEGSKADREGLSFGHRVALIFFLVGLASLVMYVATTGKVVRGLGLDPQAEERWLGVWQSLWPVVWLVGTVPLWVVDYALVSSPVMMPVRRVRDLAGHGLIAALGIALVFPVNYIATKKNERWDLAYFKTPQPGTATLAVAGSLEAQVTVRIFMPPSSEVAQELRNYFDGLAGPNLVVEVLDQAAQPRLAKALGVRDNGEVTFTQGDVDLSDDEKTGEPAPDGDDDKAKPITRRLPVSPDIEKAKRTLKKLDGEVQTILRELGHGERIAYLTSGHGELSAEGGGDQRLSDRKIVALKAGLKQLGFRVKPLGPAQGLGEKVPDDADVVLVLGPIQQFQQPEVDALSAYVHAGGSLLLAVEPARAREEVVGEDPLDGLLSDLGVRLGKGALAAEQGIQPIYHNKLDRLFLVTDGFTPHPSIATLADRGAHNVLFAPVAGFLEEVEGQPNRVTFTVRSLAVVWADLDEDLEFSADAGESKGARNLAAAIEGGEGASAWRVIVTSDASIYSDLAIGNLGNQRFIADGLNWLVGAEALAGTTESEEDVRIEHTKEGQTMWFYLTVLGVPLGVVLLGVLRLRWRRRAGGSR